MQDLTLVNIKFVFITLEYHVGVDKKYFKVVININLFYLVMVRKSLNLLISPRGTKK